MSNYYDLASQLHEPPASLASAAWRQKALRDTSKNGPTYYFFALPEIAPFTQTIHKHNNTVWPYIISYCNAYAADPQNLPNLANTDNEQRQWAAFINLCKTSRIDPWQACKAMPLFAGDTDKAAASRITDAMYGKEKKIRYLDFDRDEFFDIAITHFKEISGIDIPTGMKIAPKTPGDLLRICRARLIMSHAALGKKVGYAKNTLSLIEDNKLGISLKKIDKFIDVLELKGKSRNIFFELYEYRSIESCTYDMSESSNTGDFISAAQERLRMTTTELAAKTNLSKFFLYHVKKNTEKLPAETARLLEEPLKLISAEFKKLNILITGQYPSQNHTNEMMYASCIGDFVAAARKRISLKQSDLSAHLGYKNRSTISIIEQKLENVPQGSIDDFSLALHLKENEKNVFLNLIKKFNTPEKRRSRKRKSEIQKETQPIELLISEP